MLNARMQGEKRPSFPPFAEGQNGQGAFKERSLRSLLPLRSSSCLHPWRMQRRRGVHVQKRICVFFFTKKNLCDLCVFCGSMLFLGLWMLSPLLVPAKEPEHRPGKCSQNDGHDPTIHSKKTSGAFPFPGLTRQRILPRQENTPPTGESLRRSRSS